MASIYSGVCWVFGAMAVLFGLGLSLSRFGGDDLGEKVSDPAIGLIVAVGGLIAIGLGGAIAAVLLVLSAPGLIGGLALLTRRSWARVYAMILAALLLFWFPLGTLLGTYTLYVLLQPEIRLYFEER